MFSRPDKIAATLHVMTVVFNPIRYRSRWALYQKFAKRVRDAGAALHTVEVAFGERAFALDDAELRLRVSHELWLKENAINVCIQYVAAREPDARYFAWVDADTHFRRPDWVGETLHQLQHYAFVQMFSEAHNIGPNYEVINSWRGFAWCLARGDAVPSLGESSYYGGKRAGFWHPGFAWAARRDALDNQGGLIDWCALGGGDLFMAYALAGALDKRRMPKSLGANGVRWLREWQERARSLTERCDVMAPLGCVEGGVEHYWHGKRVDRKYNDRGQVLTGASFDPERDLKKDAQGLWQLTTRSQALRDGVLTYFRQRNEDSIDVD